MNTTNTTETTVAKRAFDLGRCHITRGARHAFDDVEAYAMIARHACNDWGDLCEADKRANQQALDDGSRIVSKYKWKDGRVALVITEAEDEDGLRSYTTILLPEEY